MYIYIYNYIYICKYVNIHIYIYIYVHVYHRYILFCCTQVHPLGLREGREGPPLVVALGRQVSGSHVPMRHGALVVLHHGGAEVTTSEGDDDLMVVFMRGHGLR